MRSQIKSVCPRLEPLEDRFLLAACHVGRLGDLNAGNDLDTVPHDSSFVTSERQFSVHPSAGVAIPSQKATAHRVLRRPTPWSNSTMTW